MLLHYLTIALRNLKRNWGLSLLSILCLATGTVIFALLEYEVDNDRFYERRLPEYGRIRQVDFDVRLEDGVTSDTTHEYTGFHYYFGPWQLEDPDIEYLFGWSPAMQMGEWNLGLELKDSIGNSRMVSGRYRNVSPGFYKYKGFTLLNGDRLPENKYEIVVKESFLRRYGLADNIGNYNIDYDYAAARGVNSRLNIVNVIKDDKWSRRENYEIFQYENAGLPRLYAVLRDGADVSDVNDRLAKKTFPEWFVGTKRIVPMLLSAPHKERSRNDIWKRLLSILVLLTGIVCYMGNLVTSFIRNSRYYRMRLCLGAGRRGLAVMVSCQVLVSFLLALILAVLSACYLVPYLNTLFPDESYADSLWSGFCYYHLPDIILLEVVAMGIVFILCAIAVSVVVFSHNIMTPYRSWLTRREKSLFKYVLICFEITLAVLSMSGSINMMASVKRPYCPLSGKELRHVLTVDLRSGSFDNSRELIIDRIKSLPDVEDVLKTNLNLLAEREFYSQAEVGELYKGRDPMFGPQFFSRPTFIFSDTSYFRFWNIPYRYIEREGREDGMFVSEVLWKLMGDSIPKVWHLIINDDFTDPEHRELKTYRVAGVFENHIGGGYFDVEDETVVTLPDKEHPYRFLYVKFRKGSDMKHAGKELEEICARFNYGYANDLIGTMGGKWLGDNQSRKNMIMLLFAAALASLLMVILSVVSVISADTGARRKEVALRKIHGAKARDIARMFIRPYVWVLVIAFCIGYPCFRMLPGLEDVPLFTWRMPLVLVITALVISLSTIWKLYMIMHTNPADVIKSE